MQININHKQKGFSLIEALVAFLILSVGMLGIASLQTMSLKSGHTAALRTVAVVKVEEILESMRSNPTAVNDYAAGTAPVPPAIMNLIVVSVNWNERDVETGTATSMNYSVAVQM